MRMKLILSCAVLALIAGCGQEPTAEEMDSGTEVVAEELVADIGRPSLGIDEVDAQRLIHAAGKLWSGTPTILESADNYVDGRQKTLMFDGGSAMIYILPDGKVWQIKLVAGKAVSCGSIDNSTAIVSAMAAAISPEMNPDDVKKLAEDVSQHLSSGNGYKDIIVDGVKWKPINDCLQTLMVRVDGL